MKIIKKHKRIFYRPGMISLMLIPLLCLCFFYKNDSFKIYGGLNVGLVPDKENFDKYKFPTLRKYRVFNFNGSESTEKQKLNELKFFLRKLVLEKDTIIGIRAHFGPKTNFDVFVSVFDILNIEKAPTFAPYKDDIYILASSNKVKSSKSHQMNCGTAEASRVSSLKYQELEKEKSNLIFMNSFFKQQWILFLGYFGIVVLNIFALIKFSKRKIIH
jgi:hypothetical protein